jgi:hypothetical protein
MNGRDLKKAGEHGGLGSTGYFASEHPHVENHLRRRVPNTGVPHSPLGWSQVIRLDAAVHVGLTKAG